MDISEEPTGLPSMTIELCFGDSDTAVRYANAIMKNSRLPCQLTMITKQESSEVYCAVTVIGMSSEDIETLISFCLQAGTFGHQGTLHS